MPLDEDGPNLATLQALIDQHRFEPTKGKLFWGVYYTMPTFHNPTGIVFSEGKCGKAPMCVCMCAMRIADNENPPQIMPLGIIPHFTCWDCMDFFFFFFLIHLMHRKVSTAHKTRSRNRHLDCV